MAIISLIFDFDITLSPAFQQRVIFDEWGIEEGEFWGECDRLRARGYDMEHAYLRHLIEMSRSRREWNLSNERLFELGRRISLYPGLSRRDHGRSIFDDLSELLTAPAFLSSAERGEPLELECYCISGGLEPMIRGAFEEHGIDHFFREIFACRLDEDSDGRIDFPMETVGHTIKTQKLFMISKGVMPSLGHPPERVNERFDSYRVPFKNMIFLGDGQTDIPAFSLINRMGGISLAVYREVRDESGALDEEATLRVYERGFDLALGQGRAAQILPADYSPGRPLKLALMHYVERIGRGHYFGE